MSTAAERLAIALNAIQCNCTPGEQVQEHRPGCWMPGLVAARAEFEPELSPWIPVDDPATPPPTDRELLVASADWPHSTQLGKPVPVRIGVVDARGRWAVSGADWLPTHYKVAPEGPRQTRGLTR